jgi:hypothetical protein
VVLTSTDEVFGTRNGGTKVAWGGPPVAAKEARNRQRFDLSPDGGDQQAEVDRLVSLGATRVEVGKDGAVVLADPDGNEFCVKRVALDVWPPA